MIIAIFLLLIIFFISGFFTNKFYPFSRYKWIYVSGFILYIPATLYISQFWHHEISDDPNDWGVFGDYIGGIYNVLTSLLVAYISYKLSKMQARGDYARKAASDILSQVLSMKKKNYHHMSIDKLLRQAKNNEIYIGKLLKENIYMLADNYVQVKYENIAVNTNLEQAVIKELQAIAYE